jgi:hypothetical protein
MPHMFPHKVFRVNEVPHKADMDDALIPLVEKVATGLNEHDLSAAEPAGGGKLFPYASLETSAYYIGYEKKFSQSMNLTVGLPYATPGVAGVSRSATIADSGEWQTLLDDNSGEALARTISTGEDILMVFAMVQSAGWKGALYSTPSDASEDEYRLQYALRVDGTVYEDTITGMAMFPEPPPQQLYRGCKAVSATSDFDFRHKMWQHDGIGLANHLQPARITRSVPVVEGSHTVEVVCRRPSRVDGKADNSGSGSSMQAFNRRLFVLRIKGWSKFSGTASPTLTIAPWEEGEVVSSASLNTARLAVVRNALNNVGEASIQRGALRNEHLPSVVIASAVRTLNPATTQTTCIGATASTYAGYGATSGWQTIGDGAGNTLYVDNGGAYFTLTSNPGIMVVLANVQVRYIGVAYQNENKVAGNFIIRYKDSTNAWKYIAETEVSITPRNQTGGLHGPATDFDAAPYGAGQNNTEDDVPLMWVFDTAVLLAGNANASTIKAIEVVCATYDCHVAPPTWSVQMNTQKASLTAFQLKGVSLV